MVKFKNFLWGTLAMLTALLMVGCDEKDNPVSTSLRMDTSTLVLSVGQSRWAQLADMLLQPFNTLCR